MDPKMEQINLQKLSRIKKNPKIPTILQMKMAKINIYKKTEISLI